MNTPRRVLLLIVSILGIASTTFGQHILACRGTDQVLIGSSSLFQMHEGETYPVIGISVNGNFMFATPLGGADYHGDRFRVLNGGQYAGVEVTLREVTNKVTEHREENKMGYRSKYSTYAANWTGYLVVSGIQSVGQCYAALQWYSDGQPVGTVAKVIGTLDPGRAVNVVLSTPISESQRGGRLLSMCGRAPTNLRLVR